LHLNLGTVGTNVLGRNIGPHGLEFCFEDGDKAVADITSLSLKHGSHFKVHRVEVRAWGGHISFLQKWDKFSLHQSWTSLAMWARTPSYWKVYGAPAYFELTQENTLDSNISL